MGLISLFSAAADHLTNTGFCVVACLALVLGAYVVNHLIDNAAYLKIKANQFEGEFRPRARPRNSKGKH